MSFSYVRIPVTLSGDSPLRAVNNCAILQFGSPIPFLGESPVPIKSSVVPRCHCITAPELSWWRHQTKKTFFAFLALCAGNSPAPVNSHKKASDTELWCFLWSAPEETVDKQSRRRWFETPWSSLWRHCYAWHYSSRIIPLKLVLAWCCSITFCKS